MPLIVIVAQSVLLLVVLLVAGSIGGYFLYKRFVGPMAEFVTNIQKVEDIEKEIKNTASFAAVGGEHRAEEGFRLIECVKDDGRHCRFGSGQDRRVHRIARFQ